MKGVPIKFRGLVYAIYDEKAFGELSYQNGCAYIRSVDGEYHRIYEDSIVQLCGYDSAGNEVYEGDVLVDSNGNEHKVYLLAMASSPHMHPHAIDKTFAKVFRLKLKE